MESNPRPPPIRRKSTLILTDDIEFDKLNLSKQEEHEPKLLGRAGSGEQIQLHEMHIDEPSQTSTSQDQTSVDNALNSQQTSNASNDSSKPPANPNMLPVEIKWVQGGNNVYVTGSFTSWRKMIRLPKVGDGNFLICLNLPIGTHRFRFVVDDELRFSDFLPTATDQLGNFVNYIEVLPLNSPYSRPSSQTNLQMSTPVEAVSSSQTPTDTVPAVPGTAEYNYQGDDDEMGNGYTRFHEETAPKPTYEYTSEIPAVFTDPSIMEQYYLTLDNSNSSSNSWLTPPQLPPHLESVILNNYNTDKNANNVSGALPIPNHVVLNHLATTSIKHNTLAVASILRYSRKYVTQILYAPLQ